MTNPRNPYRPKPPDLPRRWVRPANLYHYIHKLESWNKLGKLVIFGKLGELEDSTKLVIFTNGLPSWNNEKTQLCKLGLFQEYPYESIQPIRKLPSLSINSIT